MRRLLVIFLALGLLAGCSGPSDPPPTSIYPLDKAKLTAAEMNMKSDPILAGCIIKCTAENDLLVITGEVPSEASKQKAEELARRTEGIKKVANHLKVTPLAPGEKPPAGFP